MTKRVMFVSGLLSLLWPLCFFLALTPSLSAVTHKIVRFDKISLEQGLSQTTVYCILQDRQGYMWFGTQDGLNRYDGYRFYIYRPEPDNPHSISSIVIRSLYEDRQGNIWVATLGGLNRFDPAVERFTSYRHVPGDSHSLSSSNVNVVTEDSDGNVWVGTDDGLNRLDRQSAMFYRYRAKADLPNSLAGNRITALYPDPKDPSVLWVGTDSGLDRFNYRKEVFKHYKTEADRPDSLNHNVITTIYRAASEPEALWIGTPGGLNRFDPKGETVALYPPTSVPDSGLRGQFISAIFEDAAGNLWVGSRRQGLYTLCPQRKRVAHYVYNPRDAQSLSSNGVQAIYGDRSGVLWIGTDGGGISKFDRAREKFVHYRNDPFDPRSLSSNYVFSIFEDFSGTVWVGTYNGGLNRLDRRKDVFTHYTHNPRLLNSLSSNLVSAIHESPTRPGTIWVGTMGGGLNRFDPRRQRFRRYRYDADAPGGIGSDMVRCIYEAPSEPGILWIGTDGGGLNKFVIEDESFTRYNHRPADPDSPGSNLVRAVYEDRRGGLWVATYGGGIDTFDRETETFSHFRSDANDPFSLSSDYVQCLYEDRSGHLWVGTGGGGLNKLIRESGRFVRYRMKDGLPNEVIYGILEDRHGHLWLSTNKGLSRFDPRTETFKNYDTRDGLQSNEFNFGAYFKSRQGEMFFGGINGFNAFYPEQIKRNPYMPQIEITAFRLFNEPVAIAADRPSILKESISVTETIELTHRQNALSFEFVALSYTIPEKNQYAYQLEGFDKEWIYAGDRRFAHYTNVNSGRYIFRVKGANNDGLWNEKGRSIRIVIHPPLWTRWWAYILYGFALLGILYAIRRFELSRERARIHLKETELRALAAEAEAKAIQIENERKSQELEEARKLQLSMLPAGVPELPGLQIAVYMETATEVGGDYYDFHVDEEGGLTTVIGDATGHGLKAGTMVSMMKSLFWADASGMDILPFFKKSCRTIKKMKLWNLYMGMTLAKIKDRECTISAAGMPPFYYYNADTRRVKKFVLKGPPLGAMPDYPYQQRTIKLNSGDVLLLLTDGLPELFNEKQEMLEHRCVRKLFTKVARKEPGEIISYLVKAGKEWVSHSQPDDDITFLVIKAK
jgi:ligand-binding sensor domain-containing protein/serine phosphatase RsbU (regulator of sigma subunit)